MFACVICGTDCPLEMLLSDSFLVLASLTEPFSLSLLEEFVHLSASGKISLCSKFSVSNSYNVLMRLISAASEKVIERSLLLLMFRSKCSSAFVDPCSFSFLSLSLNAYFFFSRERSFNLSSSFPSRIHSLTMLILLRASSVEEISAPFISLATGSKTSDNNSDK